MGPVRLRPGRQPDLRPDARGGRARGRSHASTAARAVWSGDVDHAFNAAGGLHHAMPDRASGFCVYDDPAVAIAWLLAAGRGTRSPTSTSTCTTATASQSIFYDDPRVLTISIHQYAPEIGFFPGTGGSDRAGRPRRRGSGRQPAAAAGHRRRRVARGVPRGRARRRAAVPPDVLVTQLGCDTHHTDPLAHMRLTTRAPTARRRAELHALAHEAAGGRWVATGGGGYQWARVVPRAWTIYFAEMAGARAPRRDPRGVDRAARSSCCAARCRRRSRSTRRIAATGTTARERSRPWCARGRARGRRMTTRTKLICTLGRRSTTPKLVRGLVRQARRSSGSTSPTAPPRTTPGRSGSCATSRRSTSVAARRARRPPRPEGPARHAAPGPLQVRARPARSRCAPTGEATRTARRPRIRVSRTTCAPATASCWRTGRSS